MSATSGGAGSASRYRPFTFGVTRAVVRSRADGVAYLRADRDLGAFAHRITDRLVHWAQVAPERTFIARRVDGGDWRRISYAEALQSARSIAQALLDRGLSPERPVLVLSENDLEHALLALGCLYAGVPYSPLSAAYSLVSKDFAKLRHAVATLTPGLVFASDTRFESAIAATIGDDVEVVLGKGRLAGRESTPFADLAATPATSAVDAAMHATGPDTIAKFLFTSGSTKSPKAVINTQRMWCANQQQMRESMPVLADEDEPPVLVDWLPWNHTFGGNHNFGLVLYNGGTLYIDDGKPTPALIGETLRNLREISPTVYFNVPTGFEAIAHAMQGDAQLRRTLLARAKMFFYAGASLAQPVWDALFDVQEREIGERIVMATGLGMTESGPFGLLVTNPEVESGHLGLPTPGLELKLVPVEGKTEVRYRGPNITPGYWRAPDATRDAFDDEGFFCTGDAVAWIDPDDIHLGLRFDGRIAEDFKLATGTFVNVGPLRATVIAAGSPYVQDVVVTGLNQKEVGALIFINPQTCRSLSGLGDGAGYAQIAESEPVRVFMSGLVHRLAKDATGSARRIARALVMSEPPLLDRGEITDKGSINQRAGGPPPPRRSSMRCTTTGHRTSSNPEEKGTSMDIQGHAALVTGGASGLGEATARELARLGAKVAVLDMNAQAAAQVASAIGGVACACDITDTGSVTAALAKAEAAHGPARVLMNVAGIGSAKRIVQKDGSAAPLEDFVRVVNVNLIGAYNVSRLFAAACAKLDPLAGGERGVLLFTASVAAFDGQVGQQAYSASKAGLAGMTLPMARDLSTIGIRVCTIAPGLFETPLMKQLPESVQQSLAASIPFPPRLGRPEEFAQLAAHVVANGHLNGEVIRLDGALRMAPR